MRVANSSVDKILDVKRSGPEMTLLRPPREAGSSETRNLDDRLGSLESIISRSPARQVALFLDPGPCVSGERFLPLKPLVKEFEYALDPLLDYRSVARG